MFRYNALFEYIHKLPFYNLTGIDRRSNIYTPISMDKVCQLSTKANNGDIRYHF